MPFSLLACAHRHTRSLLGKGGMGEVWRARDPQIGRDVAIKVSAKQFTDRFEREVRAIGALNHPNICTLHQHEIFGLRVDDGSLPWLAHERRTYCCRPNGRIARLPRASPDV